MFPPDDAGSGRDAPDRASPEVWVSPGIRYQGNMTGLFGDQEDWFAFSGEADQQVNLRTFGYALCLWSVHDVHGVEIPWDSCSVGVRPDLIHLSWTLPSDGHFYFRVATGIEPSHYRFAFALDGLAASPLRLLETDRSSFGVDDCPNADPAEFNRTHGSGDQSIPTLAWAALKTGFRSIVTWTSPENATSNLRVLMSDGNETGLRNSQHGTVHSFVLDDLPEGKLLCFQGEYTTLAGVTVRSDWHALRLENAFNAYDEVDESYTVNLLVLANENHVGRSVLEAGFDEYAEHLWNASDGHVRAGAQIVLYGDLEKHNSGFLSCGYLRAAMTDSIEQQHVVPTCRTLADVVFSYDNIPIAAGATFRDGIQNQWAAIYMNNFWEGPLGPTGTPGEIGHVLLHELGHYAFGMMDLYGHTPDDCYDAASGISVMGSNRAAREFDDNETRCSNWQEIPEYTPSWSLLRERFPMVPERIGGPEPGPIGQGSEYNLHVREYLPEFAAPALIAQNDAGSGQDAPDGPSLDVRVEPGTRYQGNLTGSPEDQADWYAFSGEEEEVIEARTFGHAYCAWSIRNANGHEIPSTCTLFLPVDIRYKATLPTDGTYYLVVNAGVGEPGNYRFAFDIDGTAPLPVP